MSISRIDPVAALLAGAVIGSAAGGAVAAGTLAFFYHLRGVEGSGFGRIALTAGLSGIGIGALTGWMIARRSGPSRGIMAAFAGVAGAFFFIALTTYADRVAGRNGLVVLTLLCGAILFGAWMLFLHRPSPDSSP